MVEQSYQILKFLRENGTHPLSTDKSILQRLIDIQLISAKNNQYSITLYGKGILAEIEKIGTEAMLKRLHSYLK